MNAKLVSLQIRVTEIEQPLPGSRAWAAKAIELCTIEIGQTKSGHPAVFARLDAETAKTLSAANRCQWAAGYMPHFDGCGDMEFKYWPSVEDMCDHTDNEFFGVRLRPAAQALLQQFARKCRTLLKRRLRHDDAGPAKLRVKIVAE